MKLETRNLKRAPKIHEKPYLCDRFNLFKKHTRMPITFAIIKERKNPPDRRVVFSPEKCQEVIKQFPDAKIIVEASDVRIFSDEAYRDAGFEVKEDVSEADVMLGVKEVPVDALIPNKKYFFFSHTIKKQPYNRKLLKAMLNKDIQMFDHETIVNADKQRLIGFGYYAGLVGAYNGFRGLGLRDNLFELPKVENLPDLDAVKAELDKISLPNIKIILSGTGKVARGAKEILDHLKICEVTDAEYLSEEFNEPVYCLIDVSEYNKRKDGGEFNKEEFYEDPSDYESDFMKYAKVSDVFFTGHFYGNDAPYFFTKKDAKNPDFKINLVADISCDVDGPIACTLRASTIANPFYGYDKKTGSETAYDSPSAITVMAVDNLPCELPKDASEGFGEMFLENVIPAFFNNDKDGILQRARITTEDGKLTPRFVYLQDYVQFAD
ncbi:Alanine dehydrogenase/PNT, N-terminal domain/Alanine dehydrogenase/PNT, C-terminal domain protein [Aequorivita sublithincola DSM 14238]|uniref:Alanine dehydrogenase/PNT, N-terminal domain/Alanine dehydrogenase/PNT, C-terminal domain protein n=1 Tax=Aequorivita sublithincola (strain DSM 14238 / LMG 21431 / ACAM 643 / 9-3) TaxID=746697 RepID=I3YWX6_AEQSU|nr:Alanine dehydrogenase/PNT, N-terminal domain/Alanine dehydrogenase/PNT, C-terminal domain protein [Aequorivita sublithincola DSM 14238]